MRLRSVRDHLHFMCLFEFPVAEKHSYKLAGAKLVAVLCAPYWQKKRMLCQATTLDGFTDRYSFTRIHNLKGLYRLSQHLTKERLEPAKKL